MNATIQDGGKGERSDKASSNYNSFHRFFFKSTIYNAGYDCCGNH